MRFPPEATPSPILQGVTEVHIGILPRSQVVLDVMRRELPSAEDYWDGNWLVVQVTVAMGSWRGEFEAGLRSTEFEQFLAGVRHLQENLDSAAEFTTDEGWLHLRLMGDGLGHIRVEGRATDQPGTSDALSFRTDFDQTYLSALIPELEAVMTAFPVRGERPGTPSNHPA